MWTLDTGPGAAEQGIKYSPEVAMQILTQVRRLQGADTSEETSAAEGRHDPLSPQQAQGRD